MSCKTSKGMSNDRKASLNIEHYSPRRLRRTSLAKCASSASGCSAVYTRTASSWMPPKISCANKHASVRKRGTSPVGNRKKRHSKYTRGPHTRAAADGKLEHRAMSIDYAGWIIRNGSDPAVDARPAHCRAKTAGNGWRVGGNSAI